MDMSNIDKAIEVLNGQGACCGDCLREPGDPLSDCGDCARCLSRYAQALADAGLLAPDLPEPTTEFKKGMWVMVAWGGKDEEHPALVIEVRDSILDVIDLVVRQILGVPFAWATPMDLPRICNDDGQPLYGEWEEN